MTLLICLRVKYVRYMTMGKVFFRVDPGGKHSGSRL